MGQLQDSELEALWQLLLQDSVWLSPLDMLKIFQPNQYVLANGPEVGEVCPIETGLLASAKEPVVILWSCGMFK